MTTRRSPHSTWATYLHGFHAERPGITERILARCQAGGVDPYEWCAEPLARQPGRILDLACGSGPMADRLPSWLGADTSAAELGAARERERGPLLRASATRLPMPASTFDAVVCSMSMQIIEPITDALAEMSRVLKPGGQAVLLLPASGPVPWRDAMTYARLQVALRRKLGYPNDRALRSAPLGLATSGVGLRVTHDERLGFSLPLDTRADADELLASLYLPEVDPLRLAAGRHVLDGKIGGELTVPLRRVVLTRSGTAA